jgi:hypothetical protein
MYPSRMLPLYISIYIYSSSIILSNAAAIDQLRTWSKSPPLGHNTPLWFSLKIQFFFLNELLNCTWNYFDYFFFARHPFVCTVAWCIRPLRCLWVKIWIWIIAVINLQGVRTYFFQSVAREAHGYVCMWMYGCAYVHVYVYAIARMYTCLQV